MYGIFAVVATVEFASSKALLLPGDLKSKLKSSTSDRKAQLLNCWNADRPSIVILEPYRKHFLVSSSSYVVLELSGLLGFKIKYKCLISPDQMEPNSK